MKKKRLKNLEILSIDGKDRSITKNENEYSIYYSVKRGIRRHVLDFENKRLTFYFGYCNQIRDLTFQYKEVKMKLIFDIGIMNSNFEIGSLPFQKGTFKLKSLSCENGKNPPRIDNENQGFCRVSAENWEKISEEITGDKDDCCDGKPKFGYWY
jgi:hypothetical protein